MTRISLQEQYENKDVIQQINILKDDVNKVSETTENVKDDVNAVSRTAEETKTLAQQTANKVEEVGTLSQQTANKVEDVETLAQQASDKADTAVTTAQGSVTSGAIVADTVSAKLKLNKVSGASEDSVIPIASASQTGMMNAQTYAGITNLDARVSVLERKSTTVYVTFPSNDPEQSIITSTFQTKAGRPPVAGDYAVDITLNLTYGYDGSVWVKVDTDVPIPQFSIDTPGLIKGNDEDGTVFAEADGTGSIKGWDALKQSVQNNSAAIEQNSTAIEQNSTAIEQNRTAIASKLDKNAGIENAGKFVKVGDDGEIQYVSLAVGDRQIGLIVNNNYTMTKTVAESTTPTEKINLVETDKEIVSTLEINNKFVDCIISGKSVSYERGPEKAHIGMVAIDPSTLTNLNIFSIDLDNTTYFGDFEVTLTYETLVNCRTFISSKYSSGISSENTTIFNLKSKSDGSVVVNSFRNEVGPLDSISFVTGADVSFIGFTKFYIK